MEFQSLIDALQAFGLPGLGAVAVILVAVFAAKKGGLVATGDQARIANVVMSAILFGLSGDPAAESGLNAALASVLSALAFEAIKWVGKQVSPFFSKG